MLYAGNSDPLHDVADNLIMLKYAIDFFSIQKFTFYSQLIKLF
jgi:hypothetical protein